MRTLGTVLRLWQLVHGFSYHIQAALFEIWLPFLSFDSKMKEGTIRNLEVVSK